MQSLYLSLALTTFHNIARVNTHTTAVAHTQGPADSIELQYAGVELSWLQQHEREYPQSFSQNTEITLS